MRRAWQLEVARAVALSWLAVGPGAACGTVTARQAVSPGGGAPSEGFERFDVPLMGTVIEAVVPAGPRAEAAARCVFDAFVAVDRDMSEWRAGSPLSAVNEHAGGAAVEVPDDLMRVIARGIELGRATGGAFDITWAALWGLWDFGAAKPGLPDPAEVRARLARVDYREVVVDEARGTVRLPTAGMAIGLGGIAKGWALDVAARRLRAMGVEDFLLSAGGQIMTGGTHGGAPWTVALRDPRGPEGDVFAQLPASDVSVATSGDYERYFVLGGVRYHHILDPRTGMPARGARSATVVTPDATLADGLATALVVMDPRRGMALVEGLPGVEAVIVGPDGALHVSSGLRGALHIVHAPRDRDGRP